MQGDIQNSENTLANMNAYPINVYINRYSSTCYKNNQLTEVVP
jgi:hypothetical protein